MIDLSIGNTALVIMTDLRIGMAMRTNPAGDCIVSFGDGTIAFATQEQLALSLL